MRRDYEKARKIRALQNGVDKQREMIKKARVNLARNRAEIKQLRSK